MWYHGRSSSKSSKTKGSNLPPLSTGRIGRATSRNGLAWEKMSGEGSLSEDYPGVSLGLNAESWWGFDTAHVGLGQVLLPMSTPAIMTEGGVYLMYYMGGSFDETPLSMYLDDDKMVDTDVTIQGMKMKIGVAVSQDGNTWGRVEGDDPTGAAVVPFDKDDPNQSNLPDNVREELYCAWPEVVINDESANSEDKKKKLESFVMFYSTMTKDTKQKCIARATSPDGFRWTKQDICLLPSEPFDSEGCARCSILKHATYNTESGRWMDEKSGQTWTMYYEGIAKDGKHRICSATSYDSGITWTKHGTVLDVGSTESSWDINGVGSPHLIRLDDGSIRMYYTGQGADGGTAIGVAKTSAATDENSDIVEGKRIFEREQAEITFL